MQKLNEIEPLDAEFEHALHNEGLLWHTAQLSDESGKAICSGQAKPREFVSRNEADPVHLGMGALRFVADQACSDEDLASISRIRFEGQEDSWTVCHVEQVGGYGSVPSGVVFFFPDINPRHASLH
jgi:hypothetical protein